MNQSKDFKHLYQKYKKKYCLLKQKSGAKSDLENIFNYFIKDKKFKLQEFKKKIILMVNDYNEFIGKATGIENFSENYITEIINIKNEIEAQETIIKDAIKKKEDEVKKQGTADRTEEIKKASYENINNFLKIKVNAEELVRKLKWLKYKLKAAALLNKYLLNFDFYYKEFVPIVDVNAKIKNAFELNKNKDNKIGELGIKKCLMKLEFPMDQFNKQFRIFKKINKFSMNELKKNGEPITSDNPLEVGNPVTVTIKDSSIDGVVLDDGTDLNSIKLKFSKSVREQIAEQIAEKRLKGGLENFYEALENSALLEKHGGKNGLLEKNKNKLKLYNKLFERYAEEPNALEILEKGGVGVGTNDFLVSYIEPLDYNDYIEKIKTVMESLTEEEKPFWLKIEEL